MEFIIRHAKTEDWEAVVRIMEQVHDMHVAWRPDIYQHISNMIPAETFAQITEGDTFYVAETDGKVVGILELVFRHIEHPSCVTRDVIHINSMAIEEAYRGKGIGHLFFDKVKEIKEQKHFDAIELKVNAKNQAAYEMYTRYGFTTQALHMELQ